MKKHLYFLFTFSFLFLLSSTYAQSVGHGQQQKAATVNFMDLVHYEQLHPVALVRQDPENDDDDARPHHSILPPISELRKIPNTPPLQSPPPPGSNNILLPISPSPMDSFESTLDNGTLIPPDTHGGVDSNYCITAINSVVHIQTRAGGNVSSVSLNTFWQAIDPSGGTYDPRVYYDETINRWIMITDAHAESAQSAILIAVTATSNPTGTWYMFSVLADNTGTNWLDYPNVGFNKNWIVVTGNMFTVSASNYSYAKVFAFNKANILSNTSATYTSFTQNSSFSIAPAVTHDNTLNSIFAVESWDGTNGLLRLWKISGPVGSETMTSVSYPTSNTLWWGQSNSYSGSGGADFAPQSGTSNLIQCNDDRIYQAEYINQKIWCAHNVFLPYNSHANPTRCSAMWWQMDTLGNPVQNGLVDDPSNVNFYSFPSVTPNQNDDALIGFSIFSTAIHPSCAYALHMHTDPSDSMRPVYTYRHGQNTYFKNFGSSRDRWGDYSSTVLDPVGSINFWTIEECSASAVNTWDTWWAQVPVCIAPTAPISVTIPATHCIGTAAIYTVSAVGGSTSYTYTVTGTGWSGTSNTNTISLTAGSGIANVSVTDSNSCGASPAFIFTVAATPAPSKPSIAVSAIPCSGGIATYSVTSVAGATAYNWQVLGTGWTGASATNNINVNVGTGNGTIICSVQNVCGTSAKDTVISSPSGGLGTPTSIDTPSLICNGLTAIFETPAILNATGYVWTVSGTGWSGSSNTNTITVTVGSTPGTLTVYATNACGNSVPYTISNIVPAFVPSSAPVVNPTTAPCTGATINYSATPLPDATSYLWSATGTGWTFGPSTTDTVNITAGSGNGIITCQGQNACGLGPATTIQLTPASVPATATVINQPSLICSGSAGSYSTPAIPNATSYTWTVSGAGWSGNSNTNTIVITSGSGAGTITVSGINNCGAGLPFTINNVSATLTPTATYTFSSQSVYVGSNAIITYTGNAPATATYTWAFDGGTASPGTGIGPQTVSWAIAGIKHITLDVADSGCSGSFIDSISVIIPNSVNGVSLQSLNVDILPNPNTGTFDIVFSNPINSSFKVRLADIQGKEIFYKEYNGTTNNRVSINTSGLPDAIYTATIDINGYLINKKVVIER